MIKSLIVNLIKFIVFAAIGAIFTFKVIDKGVKDCCPVCYERIKLEFKQNK